MLEDHSLPSSHLLHTDLARGFHIVLFPADDTLALLKLICTTLQLIHDIVVDICVVFLEVELFYLIFLVGELFTVEEGISI